MEKETDKETKEPTGKLVSIMLDNGELQSIEKLADKYGISLAQVCRGYLRIGKEHCKKEKIEENIILQIGSYS